MKLPIFTIILLLFTCFNTSASEATTATISLTEHWVGYAAIAIFVVAYIVVIFEEQLHMRKSKPMLLAAGVIWFLVAIVYQQMGDNHSAAVAIRHNFLEYAELFFFLLVAMTYINSMLEREVFDACETDSLLKV